MANEVATVINTEEVVGDNVVQSTSAQVIKELLANGAKRVNNLRVKNTTHSEEDNYDRISFTLASPVRGYVSDDNGETYREGMVTTIFSSTYAIAGALKEDEDLAWLANEVVENPKVINVIFNGCTIDIIQEEVAQGQVYKNPFSTSKGEGSTVQHDSIYNNIIKFKLGKTGARFADRLADKLLGF